MKLTAVHVDDHQSALDDIKLLLKSHTEIDLVASINTYKEALVKIPRLKPNILLLDCDLDLDHTSFQLLKEIDHTNMAIVFITQFEEYAIRAFEFSAVHYLVKPCKVDKLVEMLQRVKQRLALPPSKLPIETLNENLLSASKILIEDTDGWSVLDLKNIVYLQLEDERIKIHYLSMAGLKHKVMYQPMKTMYEYLKSNAEVGKHFSRASNDYVLNLDRVTRVNSGKTEVELSVPVQLNHIKFEISRRYKEDFMADLKARMLLHKK